MRELWTRLNYMLRHQIYLRVLPVVLLSVLLLGIFSTMAFERHTLRRAGQNQQSQLEHLGEHLRASLGKLALSAELRKSQLMAATAGLDTATIEQALLTLPHVSAAVLLEPDLTVSRSPQLSEELAGSGNRETLRRLVGRAMGSAADAKRPPGVILESGALHLVRALPPLPLWPRTSADVPDPAPVPHLPLIIEHRPEVNARPTLLLVDLRDMLDQARLPDWLCIVGGDGHCLYRRDATGSGFLAEIQGGGLRELVESAGPDRAGMLLNRWSDPWLVSTAESPVFPSVTLVMARPAADFRTLMLRYLAFVSGMAIFAMLSATWGVMRVMRPFSRRLRELSENMAGLAQGEYSHRMQEGRWDEIGQLVGYFNLMAVSLDEAHREVRQKTLHLRAALENMRMLDKAKDDFLILISHEVRTPLTAIMGGVDYLKTRLDQASAPQQELLQELNVTEVVGIIQSSGERLSGFMSDAIQMTAIQSTDHTLDLVATPVVDLIELGLVGIRERAAEREITVDNQLQDRVWSLLGDRRVLKVALEKILDNALKHNREGGRIIIREAWEVPDQGAAGELVTAEGRQALEDQPGFSDWADEELRWRLIEIFNSGDPIPVERRQALFGKFELVGRIEHHHKGSGLSLPIAQSAVAGHGGRILLHSDGKEGNSFYLLLPTLLDARYVQAALDDSLGNQAGQGVGGAAGHEQVGQVADLAAFKIEVQDPGSRTPGRVDQSGGGVDGTGRSDHEEEVTVGGRRE